MNLTQSQLAKYMDHTLLKADATLDGIDRVVAEAKQFGCASVCVNPFWVPYVARLLDGSGVATCTVVGFPLGASSTASKVFETTDAIANGADEIDMVINLGWVKEGQYDKILQEINSVKISCHGNILKVIIETCLLTDEEKIKLCEVVSNSHADYIKTSTGFAGGGATREDVALMAAHMTNGKKIKAAGGIASLQDAEDFLKLGADRLGTSRIVKAVKELEAKGEL